MRQFAVFGSLGLLAVSVWAAPPPESSRASAAVAKAAALADRDGDHLSDGLQAALGAARPGDLVRVVATFSNPAQAAAARQALEPHTLHHAFRLIPGFAATMTAAQARALARQPGVRRVEEDFPVTTQLNAARADFGTDAARASFGVSGAGIKACVVDTGVDPAHEQLDSRPIPFFDAVNGRTLAYDDHGHGTHVASIAFGDGSGGGGGGRPLPRRRPGGDALCGQGAEPVRLRHRKPGHRRHRLVRGPGGADHLDEPGLRRGLGRPGRAEPGG